MSMVRLRQRDLVAFSRALETLYARADADTLPKRVLTCLRDLFDCEFATFAFMDLRQGLWHTFFLAPTVSEWPGTEVQQRHLHEDPAAAYIRRTGDSSAVKMSDFVSLRQYRSLGVYHQVFRRVGCDRRIGMAMHDGAPVTMVSTLNRKGRDFTEEDRAMLNLLRPHLLQANNQAYTSRRVQAAREAEGLHTGNASGGLGEIDAEGRPLWLTARAEALLEAFFPRNVQRATSNHLPEALLELIAPALKPARAQASDEPRARHPHVWRFAGTNQQELQVRLVAGAAPGCWQIFLETVGATASAPTLSEALKLTARQAEILHWLKQGKTNWEIGAILGISGKTVGKHLEHIFARLNVENRNAAVRVAIEAEAGL